MTRAESLYFPSIKCRGNSLQASVSSITSVQLTIRRNIKMISAMTKIIFTTLALAIFISMFDFAEANYKNAPMNGIMFGKRGPTVAEYDSRSKAFTALCEIATEACQTWFPSQENN